MPYNKRIVSSDEYHYETVDTTVKYTPKYAAPVSYFTRSPSYSSFTLRARSPCGRSLSRSTTIRDCPVEINVEEACCSSERQPRQETRVVRYEAQPKRSVSRSTCYTDSENVIDIKVESNQNQFETTSVTTRPRSSSRSRCCSSSVQVRRY